LSATAARSTSALPRAAAATVAVASGGKHGAAPALHGLSRKKLPPPPSLSAGSRRLGKRSGQGMKSTKPALPGTDTAGRRDQSARGVPFYPAVRGLDGAKGQSTAIRPPTKRNTQPAKAATHPY
jgi:hypothetical protein